MERNQISDRFSQYPEFLKIVKLISEHNPLQHKRIHSFIMTQDKNYWEFAENLSTVLNGMLLDKHNNGVVAAEAYNNLCMEMLKEQIKFHKKGVYPTSDVETAQERKYDQSDVMYKYMLGLLISIMLWPNHYKLFRFFQDVLKQTKPSSYLEIGAGHGMFIVEVLHRFPKLEITICDISQTSIDLCRKILISFGIDVARVRFIHEDFLKTSFDRQLFDFVTIGEVLEHVSDPVGLMRRVRNLLLLNGTVYVSTCANCPAVDHVYHFHSVNEIRQVFNDSNFLVAEEIILPAEDVPMDRWEEELITVNYGAKLYF